jgi:CBS domain-containing protein
VITVHARVKDVMTTRVIAARADASYADLAAMLREHRVIADGFFTYPAPAARSASAAPSDPGL